LYECDYATHYETSEGVRRTVLTDIQRSDAIGKK